MRIRAKDRTLNILHQTPNYPALAANLIHALSVSSAVLKFSSLNDNSVSASVHIFAGASIVAPAILDYCFALKRSQLKAPNPHLAVSLLVLSALGIDSSLNGSNDSTQTIITRYTLLSIIALLVHGAAISLNATDAASLKSTDSAAAQSGHHLIFAYQKTPFNTNRHLIRSILSNGCQIIMLGLMLKALNNGPSYLSVYTLAGILTSDMLAGAVSFLAYNHALTGRAFPTQGSTPVITKAIKIFCAASILTALIVPFTHNNHGKDSDSSSTSADSKFIGAGFLATGACVANLFASHLSAATERTLSATFCGKDYDDNPIPFRH